VSLRTLEHVCCIIDTVLGVINNEDVVDSTVATAPALISTHAESLPALPLALMGSTLSCLVHSEV
jgi:hypothetical protein